MEEIQRYEEEGIKIEKINLVRATMQEAQQIKENLIEDALDFKKIIVDLSSSEYVDSTFFGALVYAHRQIKEKGANIVLIMSNSFMKRTFMFQDIAKIFRVYNSIREALDDNNEEEIQ